MSSVTCLSLRNGSERAPSSPAGVSTALASVLIFTIVVDVVGNVLVILSVLRNKKLRNAVFQLPAPQASGFVMGLSVIGSVFNITAIRHQPLLLHLPQPAVRTAVQPAQHLLLPGPHLAAHALATVPNLFVGSLRYDPRVYSCTFAQTVSAYYTISVWWSTSSSRCWWCSYCYLRIWVLVVRVKRRAKPERRAKVSASDVRNFLTMFLVFVLFAMCLGAAEPHRPGGGRGPVGRGARVPSGSFVTSYFMAYFKQLPQRRSSTAC
ncbi:hypothetical protein CRUP_001840 [Coryphaenoides rupestris]|nr:hypothetical protein CRUP_001840 [Coryphaenoides rupestris]